MKKIIEVILAMSVLATVLCGSAVAAENVAEPVASTVEVEVVEAVDGAVVDLLPYEQALALNTPTTFDAAIAETEPVAQIEGGDTYTSLSAALDAASEGDTVTLLSDVILTETTSIPTGVTLEIPEDVTVTITEKTFFNYGSIEILGNLVADYQISNYGEILIYGTLGNL